MQPEKKQNQFSVCFGKILLTQEIIHTRNEILSPALGNYPNRKRLHPSLDLKNIVRKSRHCACLPHLVQRVPGSHQKFFSLLTQSLTFWRLMEVYNKRQWAVWNILSWFPTQIDQHFLYSDVTLHSSGLWGKEELKMFKNDPSSSSEE